MTKSEAEALVPAILIALEAEGPAIELPGHTREVNLCEVLRALTEANPLPSRNDEPPPKGIGAAVTWLHKTWPAGNWRWSPQHDSVIGNVADDTLMISVDEGRPGWFEARVVRFGIEVGRAADPMVMSAVQIALAKAGK